MPGFLPFRGIRFRDGADLASLSAPPYDVIDEEQRALLEALHPHNVVRLTLPRDTDGSDRYQRAAALLNQWLDEGALVTDDAHRFYGYRMRFTDEDGRERTTVGVIGALEVTEPGAGGVLPHERTMSKPKSDRLDLLRATRANLEPIWGLSLAEGLTALVGNPGGAVASCVDDGVEHCLWVLDPDHEAAVTAAVAGAPVVLADGHHRYETSLNYRREMEQAGAGPGGHERIMTLVVELADDQLAVQAIHRLVHGPLPDLSPWFDTEVVDDAGALWQAMAEAGAMGLVLPDGCRLLRPKPGAFDDVEEALADVDAARFEVAFAGCDVTYRHDRHAVAALVEKGEAEAGVLLRPVGVPVIQAVARAGGRMPQKTTFFHPKPRTGMVIRSLDS